MNDIKSSLQKFLSQGYRVLFLDETMFTYNTFQTKEYSVKGQHIVIPEQSLRSRTYAVVAVVSVEGALEYYQVHEKSVNIDTFLSFLSNLR